MPLPSGSCNGKLHSCDSGIAVEQFYEGPLLRLLFLHVKDMAKHPYELNIAVIAILSKLAFFPHPYLHEILLNPEIPITRGTNTLWSSMQILARHLLLEIPRIEGFQKRIAETAKRLLINPPMIRWVSILFKIVPIAFVITKLSCICISVKPMKNMIIFLKVWWRLKNFAKN